MMIAGNRLVDKLRQMAAALDGGIKDEMQLRHDAQLDAMRQLTAQKTAGALQTLLGFFVLAIQTGEKDLGMRIVARHFNAGDGHQTHTRIVDSQAHQLGNFTLHLLGYSVGSCKISHCFFIMPSFVSYVTCFFVGWALRVLLGLQPLTTTAYPLRVL